MATEASPTAPAPSTTDFPLAAAVLDAGPLDDFFVRVLLQTFLADMQAIHSRLPSVLVRYLGNAGNDILMALLRTMTIFACRGQTPGLSLLGLRLVSSARHRSHNPTQAGAPLVSNWRLVGYTTLSIVIPTLYQRWKIYWIEGRNQRLLQLMVQHRPTTWSNGDPAGSEDDSDGPDSLSMRNDTVRDYRHGNAVRDGNHTLPNDGRVANRRHNRPVTRLQLAWARKERAGDLLIHSIDRLIPTMQLIALILCWSGVSSTPSAAMMLSRLTLEKRPVENPQAPQGRKLSVDYAHRRWLYHELTRTARLLWSGLAMASTWRPIAAETMRNLRLVFSRWSRPRCQRLLSVSHFLGIFRPNSSDAEKDAWRIEPHDEAEDKGLTECLICRMKPIVVPVIANCSCQGLYCYTCLYNYSLRRSAETRDGNNSTYCIGCRGRIGMARFM